MANLKNPVKAIRAKCLDCSCGQVKEVELCPITDCALYPFRFGRNPYRQPMTEEQRAKRAEKARKNFGWGNPRPDEENGETMNGVHG